MTNEERFVDAARNKNIDLLRQMLAQGIFVDARNKLGDTALFWAVANDDVKTASMLLEHGADMHLMNGTLSPLTFAQRDQKQAVLVLFDKVQNPPTQERWVLMKPDQLAHVYTCKDIQEKLTTIFNFKTRQSFIISDGLDSKARAMTQPQSLDDLPQEVVAEALEKFKKMGGKTDDDFARTGIRHLSKQRITVQKQ